MIYPSGRAAILAAASSLPAIAVAVLVPAYWYAGLFIVLLVLALTAADALATPGAKALQAALEAPRAAYVGQDVTLDIMARVGGSRRFEAAVEHDARLVPAASGSELTHDGRTMRFAAVRRGPATIDALWLRWPGMLGLVWRQKRIDLDRTGVHGHVAGGRGPFGLDLRTDEVADELECGSRFGVATAGGDPQRGAADQPERARARRAKVGEGVRERGVHRADVGVAWQGCGRLDRAGRKHADGQRAVGPGVGAGEVEGGSSHDGAGERAEEVVEALERVGVGLEE
jgi:hypothetical protein